jgi:hypothetical protein
MFIIKISGGLGNQMFQYCFGRYLKHYYKSEIFFDISSFDEQPEFLDERKLELSSLEIDIPIIDVDFFTRFKKLSNNKKILSSFKHLILGIKDEIVWIPESLISASYYLPSYIQNRYFSGYWQSIRYLNTQYFDFKKGFKLKKDYQKELLNHSYKDTICNSNSVSIQVRRGDYLNVGNLMCDLRYYRNALANIEKSVRNPKYFVFSDDIEWCQTELDIGAELIFIKPNENLPFEDMHLMSLCKHNIIVNSTFGWWAALMNDNTDKVIISPKKWKNELNLKSFIKL